MPLTTLVEQQDAVKRWLWDRDDLSAMYADFVTLCEAKLNNNLRVWQMETSTSVTLSSGTGSLPSDYLAWRRVNSSDNPVRQLEWLEPNAAEYNYFANTAAGIAEHFTITGSTIRTFPPASGSSLTLLYYQKIPSLLTNASGNWVTARSPGLYLYGTLLQAAPFLDDDERAQTWGLLYSSELQDLKGADKAARYSKPVMRVSGATP